MTSVCIVDVYGAKRWCLNGKLHRVDGPAVECANGSKGWYMYGALHRVDGPAYEWSNGSKGWYLYGDLHRVDGPAVERAGGYKEWHLNGVELTHTEFIRHIKHAFRETVIALLPLELPPYELLALLEYAFPVLATSEHHQACIQLIMGMAASRRRIKSNS